MPPFRTLFWICGFAISSASSCRSSISWGLCDEMEVNGTLPMDCGTLRVPLDYTNPNLNSTLKLELARVPAVVQPAKGSVLLNFGGPGEPDRQNLAELASILQPLSGGLYDLIAFDTRGTGNTLPFSCTDNDAAVMTQLSVLSNSSDVSLGTLWARGTIVSQECFDNLNLGEGGSLISTAFVARDLMSVVDALSEDGMLRYWGFSYGTTLGATVAAMFPDRIDKMVLDGVQNPHQYYHAHADFEEWTDSDEVFSGIFSGCVAAPENCALAYPNVTAAELEQSAWNLLDTVKYHPIPVGTALLDYSTLKGFYQQALYAASSWPNFAIVLDTLLTANSTQLAQYGSILEASTSEANVQLLMGNIGIHCGDRDSRTESFDDIVPSMDTLYNMSRVMGDATGALTMLCAQWKIVPKERYEGDFQIKTKNPVLFIGNTYDGHTPLKSAYNVSSGFEGSVVLEVNGYGHTSLGLPSICSLETVSAYWLNGTLPEPGTICQVDAPLYSNVTWIDIFQNNLRSGESYSS